MEEKVDSLRIGCNQIKFYGSVSVYESLETQSIGLYAPFGLCFWFGPIAVIGGLAVCGGLVFCIMCR